MGLCFYVDNVVLIIGIFFGGFIYIGLENYLGGCVGDLLFIVLVCCLCELLLWVGWLKIGMLLWIDGCSVDFLVMIEQLGDMLILVMFFFGLKEQYFEQVSCWIIYINVWIYEIIVVNFDCLLMYFGVIEGIGLCYCLLIEDKIYCFVDKESYQVFFELEGLMIYELYFNGIFMFLLFDV